MSDNLQTYENIDWEWDDTIPSGDRGRAVLEDKEGNRFEFTASETDKPAELKRFHAASAPVWVRCLPGIAANSAALLSGADQLYGALFSDGATGGQVIALNAISGEILWTVRIEGIGTTLHSKYRNRIQLRFINSWLVVFGDESSGKYIEVFDPENGHRMYSQVIRP